MAENPDAAVPLSAVCNFWKDFDLSSRRNWLDSTALEVAQFQEDTVEKRRDLAACTKKFRRTAGEDVIKAVGSLLKQYQEEIDRLTKRAKHGESAYLELYQKLYEAPDPAPGLLLAVENLSATASLQARNEKMAQELEDFRAESKAIKNQDLTIRKLEEKVKLLEMALGEKEHEVKSAKEEAAAEVDAAAVQAMQEHERRLTQMLEEAQSSLGSMQRLYRIANDKLFELQSQNEESAAGSASELELASTELERVQQRLLSLEEEKTQLQSRLDASLATAASGPPAPPPASPQQLEELASAQRELSSLRDEVERLKLQLEDTTSSYEGRCVALKRALEAQEAHSKALEDEMAVRPTAAQMDDIRKQLRAFQVLHYGSEDDAPGEGPQASVEAALLAKVRTLEHEATMSKLQVNQLTSQLEAAEGKLEEVQADLQEKTDLVLRLEEDLVAVEQARNSSGDATIDDMLAGNAKSNGDPGGDDHSMLQVLCSQRDRFRNKVVQLEDQLAKLEAQLASAQADVKAARADNVALIERLRYVQSYSAMKRRDIDVEAGVAAESKYAREYEKGLDPFSEFKGRERDSSKHTLNLADKALYRMGQLVVGSKWARLSVFVYMLVLHLLIFVVLMRLTHQHHDTMYAADHHHGHRLPGETRGTEGTGNPSLRTS